MNPYISAPKNLLYFSLFFLTVGLDPGDQVCFNSTYFLLYREEDAALVLAVVLLRIGCIAVAGVIRAPGLAVLLIYFILAEILFQPKRQISSCGEDKTIVY